MQSNNSWLKMISRFGKIGCSFIFFFIEGTFSTLQASDASEVLFMRLESKGSLAEIEAEDIKKATLHMKSKQDEIEFISEKTNFKWDQKEVNFKEQPSEFLEKVETLFLDTKKVKGHSKFNHLCVTLYAIYQKSGTQDFKITESPLFAKKSKKYILNTEGNLVRNPNRRVIFYTKTKLLDDDRWAYFTTQNGLSSKVKSDPQVFSISSDSYDCETKDCNVVCKEFFHPQANECPYKQHSECQHTEPHVLFHIIKHSKHLFSPLIQETGGVGNIKSVGLRFFSYYQSCLSCIDLLSKSRQIEISTGSKFPLNYMFYFHLIYKDAPIIKVEESIINLSDNSKQYLFRGFLKDGIIYYDNPEEEEEPNKAGAPKGFMELARSRELKNNNKIICIYYLGIKRQRIYLCE